MPGFDLSLQSHSLLLFFAVLVLFVGWSYLLYRRTEAPLKSSTKALLLVLRSLAFLAVIFALCQPLLTLKEKVEKPPKVAVLLDTSASMSFQDSPPARLAVAKEVLSKLSSAPLPGQAQIEYWTFSDSLRALTVQRDSLAAEGPKTAMGEALLKLRQQSLEENLGAAVVVSDGGSNSGVDPVAIAGRLEVPIYAVGVGDPHPPLDVAIREVGFPEVAYADIPAKVTCRVAAPAGGRRRLPLLLKSEGELYGKTDLLFDQAGEQTAEIEFIPKQTGTKFFQLSIPPQRGERFTTNNYRSFSVEVLKSRLKILLVSSRPDWEFAFLKRALENNPNLELKPVVYGPGGASILESFPSSAETLREHDVLIYVDPSYGQLSGRADVLKSYLREGHAILFLLGDDFSSSKAWSPVEGLLPLDFAGSKVVGKGPHPLSLTADGLLHPVTRLTEAERENRDLWNEVPPFEFMVENYLKSGRESGAGAKAVVLLTSPLEVRPPREIPAVVVSERHGGKIMVVTVFPLWRWDFMPHGFGEGTDTYRKFFANAIRWLATPLEAERMKVYSQKRIYRYGEEIPILAKFYDESFEPLEGVETTVEVSADLKPGSDNARKLTLSLVEQESGGYRGTISCLPAGSYTFVAEAFWRGRKLGSFGGEFEVEEYSLEEQSLAADFELLKRLSQLSGGGFFRPDQIDSLITLLDFDSKVVTRRSEIQLWNQPWLLVLAVASLAAEWIIRKRHQLS